MCATTGRRPELQDLLDAARAAYAARATDPRSRESLDRIFAALRTPSAAEGPPPARLPACAHLGAAADPARFDDPVLRRLVEAVLRVEPRLAWRRRGGEATNASANFAEGHANAMIVGPAGLEPRSDAWLGVSLLAPGVRYPDHDHAPEETYLVLSPGAFRQADRPWFEPGVGGSFYNTPGIRHAMRAGAAPLLAVWALWSG